MRRNGSERRTGASCVGGGSVLARLPTELQGEWGTRLQEAQATFLNFPPATW